MRIDETRDEQLVLPVYEAGVGSLVLGVVGDPGLDLRQLVRRLTDAMRLPLTITSRIGGRCTSSARS